MASTQSTQFRLTVLNPGGRDPQQFFSEGAGETSNPHPPINFHAYAACTHGSFQCETKAAAAEGTPVLLLLRGDFSASERALAALQKAGRSVAVSLKETGLHQIANQLRDPARLARFVRIVRRADGCIAPTPEAADIYRAIRGGAERVAFIPTPYPIDDKRWDFSRPVEERSEILIGTREWDVPSRNHLAVLLLARKISDETGTPVTVYNFDGRKGARRLSEIAIDKLRVLDRRLAYPNYLREVARHKIVLQLDTSFVPGQVAGDALLCRVPCIGGNGAIERLAFPEFCGFARSIDEIGKIASRLLTEQEFYREAVTGMLPAASKRLSFEIVAEQLADYFGRTPIASK
jgi:hypothetical protein